MAAKQTLAPVQVAARPAATGPPGSSNGTTGTHSVVSKDGTRIAYERAGTGPNLLLVPGALGYRSLSFTQRFAEVLSERFTVINYDRRGRGESTDTPPYAVQREIEDIEGLVRAVGPSHVFGMSSGAALALEAAASGVPMLSVIAFEPPYATGEHRRPELVQYEPNVKALIAEGRRDDALKLFMRIVGVPGVMLAVMRVLPVWKKLRSVAHTLPYDAAVMNGFEPPLGRLGSIRVPALIVYGEKSPPMLQDGTRFVAKSMPGSELLSLPKQSHNLKAAAILPALQDFAGRHASGPRTTSKR